MTDLRMIRSPRLNHAEYADAAIVRTNQEVVFMAGLCPLDGGGQVVARGNIAAQTRQALANMDEVLSRCRVELEDVAFLRVLVVATAPEHLGTAWTEVRDHFGDHDVPSTLQGVSVLGYSGQLVEIEPIAVRSPL
ncbi:MULTISPECIES: RidA family protein [Microbacterium]|uniref:RidA family protein n=1 Tax=Microbacterium TaxID=33882 RepID=UPI001EF63B58|nr:RidA family protein [Microbacterium aurum]MCG7414848.1 RidA family protein [Microbacterium aurum]